MKLAIMQPYFFPYIGYFQLISAVDKFVVFDDVNYIKRGWINRNRILMNNNPHMFTLPLVKASQNKFINEIEILPDSKIRANIVANIRTAYSKSPQFDIFFPVVEKIFNNAESNLNDFIVFSLKMINKYMDINTTFLLSSEIEKEPSLKGEEKVLAICSHLNADEYINPIGGTTLYSQRRFADNDIKLSFLKPQDISYQQFNKNFIPRLSIIDLLMFNAKDKVTNFLNRYELIQVIQ